MLPLAYATESVNTVFVFSGQISQSSLDEEKIYKSDRKFLHDILK
jgi:hypothetical protein